MYRFLTQHSSPPDSGNTTCRVLTAHFLMVFLPEAFKSDTLVRADVGELHHVIAERRGRSDGATICPILDVVTEEIAKVARHKHLSFLARRGRRNQLQLYFEDDIYFLFFLGFDEEKHQDV